MKVIPPLFELPTRQELKWPSGLATTGLVLLKKIDCPYFIFEHGYSEMEVFTIPEVNDDSKLSRSIIFEV